MNNKKIIIFNIVLFLVVGSITAYSIAYNDTDFKMSVFDGIKINVPSGSEFVKIDNQYYKDNTRYLEINTSKNHTQVMNTKLNLENNENLSKIKIKELTNQTKSYISANGTVQIFIFNKDENEGILITNKNKTLAISMAKTVIFSNNKHENVNIQNEILNIENTTQNKPKNTETNTNGNTKIDSENNNNSSYSNDSSETNYANYPSQDMIYKHPYNLMSIAEARSLAEKNLNNESITIIGPYPISGAWLFIMKDKKGEDAGIINVYLTEDKVDVIYTDFIVSDDKESTWGVLSLAEARSLAENHMNSENITIIGPYLSELGFNFILQDNTGKNIGFLAIDRDTKEIYVVYE